MIVSQVLKPQVAYREPGADDYDRLEPERLVKYLVRRLEQPGHQVTLTAEDAAPSPDLAGAGCPE